MVLYNVKLDNKFLFANHMIKFMGFLIKTYY